MSAIYLALVHHPIRDREGSVVATAVTNIDVHDIARSCRTFALKGYFVVTPIEAQRKIVDRILEHWSSGAGKRRVPERGVALSICAPSPSLDHAIAAITEREGTAPRMVVTSARDVVGGVHRTFAALRDELSSGDGGPYLLVFGTGHGLADEVLRRADLVLEPIRGRDGYNHLSVRAAVAVILDRLLGGRV